MPSYRQYKPKLFSALFYLENSLCARFLPAESLEKETRRGNNKLIQIRYWNLNEMEF